MARRLLNAPPSAAAIESMRAAKAKAAAIASGDPIAPEPSAEDLKSEAERMDEAYDELHFNLYRWPLKFKSYMEGRGGIAEIEIPTETELIRITDDNTHEIGRILSAMITGKYKYTGPFNRGGRRRTKKRSQRKKSKARKSRRRR
jgi:hypothetical protein